MITRAYDCISVPVTTLQSSWYCKVSVWLSSSRLQWYAHSIFKRETDPLSQIIQKARTKQLKNDPTNY